MGKSPPIPNQYKTKAFNHSITPASLLEQLFPVYPRINGTDYEPLAVDITRLIQVYEFEFDFNQATTFWLIAGKDTDNPVVKFDLIAGSYRVKIHLGWTTLGGGVIMTFGYCQIEGFQRCNCGGC